MLAERADVVEGALPLDVVAVGIVDRSAPVGADERGVVTGRIGPRLVALHVVGEEIVPLEPLDGEDVERSANVCAEVVGGVVLGPLVDHGHGVEVVHADDAAVTARLLVGGVVDGFGGVVEERLPECVVIGWLGVAPGVEGVVVEVEPSVEHRLADVGLEHVLVGRVAALQALVLLDIENGAVGELVGTARESDAVLVADGGAGDFVEPVGVVAVERPGVGGGVVVDGVLELPGRHGLGAVQHGLDAHLSVVFQRSGTFAGALGRDDDHAVGTPRAVDGGGRTVLEHVDALDLLEVDVADVGAHDAVDDDQRTLPGGEGVGAAQHDLERSGRVAAAGIGDRETGDLALQEPCGGGERTGVHVVAAETGDRTGQLLFGGRAVADDHHGVERTRFLGQLHVDGRARADGFLDGVIP